jgi:hypothetical protein
MREATLIGLPPKDEADHYDKDGDSWFEVLPVGKFDELALDLKEKVFLVTHMLYALLISSLKPS